MAEEKIIPGVATEKESDEVLEEILNSLESISNRIDDIQISLLEENEVETSSDLDIPEVDF